METRFAFFCLLAFLCPLSALADRPTYNGQYPIRAVATVGMVGDAVQSIGGSYIKVETIIGAGGDPHLYKASPRDMGLLAGADIIFYSGLFLEGKMTEILANYSRKKPAIAVAETIPQALLLKPTAFEGHFDPHVWMDVSLWSEAVAGAREALVAFDPSHADEFRKNAEVYLQRLRDLHEQIKILIASIPQGQRALVTAHDAFNYFGRAYDIEVHGIQGISTDSEAGLKDINRLVDFLVARKIPGVFVESSVSQKNVMALIEGTASRGHQMRIGGELYSDAMGAAGTPEGTYVGMLLHNAKTITNALGGTLTKDASK